MKKQNCRKTMFALLFAALLVLLCGMASFAEGLSDDNSLYSLGITTEGATVTPEFYYSTIEYEVTVPAGTASLALDPVTSNENATILDISGTDLTDGQTTVTITVSSQSGIECTYYLYVTADAGDAAGTVQEATEAQTEPVTEKQTEPETEPETEDPRYVRVARDTLEEANNTITALKDETSDYRDRLDQLTMITYALIGVCVVLLFVVINLLLKKRDLRLELKSYRSYGYTPEGGQEVSSRSEDTGNSHSGKKNRRGRKNYPEESGEQAGGEDPYVSQREQQTTGTDTFVPQQNRQPDGGNGRPRNTAGQQDSDALVHERRKASSVPKPSRDTVKNRKAPAYDPPAAPYRYEPPKDEDKGKNNVEVTMIDL